MLVVSDQLPVFHVPWKSFQEDQLHDLPWHSEANRLVIPLVFLCTLKNECYISFLPVTGDFTWPSWLFKYLWEWLQTTATNSLKTLQCILSGPIDVQIWSKQHRKSDWLNHEPLLELEEKKKKRSLEISSGFTGRLERYSSHLQGKSKKNQNVGLTVATVV